MKISPDMAREYIRDFRPEISAEELDDLLVQLRSWEDFLGYMQDFRAPVQPPRRTQSFRIVTKDIAKEGLRRTIWRRLVSWA